MIQAIVFDMFCIKALKIWHILSVMDLVINDT